MDLRYNATWYKKEAQKELGGRRVVNVFLVICCPFFDSSPFKPDDDIRVVKEGVLKFLYKLRETETETTAVRLCVMFNELGAYVAYPPMPVSFLSRYHDLTVEYFCYFSRHKTRRDSYDNFSDLANYLERFYEYYEYDISKDDASLIFFLSNDKIELRRLFIPYHEKILKNYEIFNVEIYDRWCGRYSIFKYHKDADRVYVTEGITSCCVFDSMALMVSERVNNKELWVVFKKKLAALTEEDLNLNKFYDHIDDDERKWWIDKFTDYFQKSVGEIFSILDLREFLRRYSQFEYIRNLDGFSYIIDFPKQSLESKSLNEHKIYINNKLDADEADKSGFGCGGDKNADSEELNLDELF